MRGLGITPTTVFAGGNFVSANGIARTRLAAFQVSNGAMTSWAPAAAGGYVWAMTMSPDLSRVIPAGSFTTLSGQPAYGMGSVMASDATVNPWPAQEKIRAAGANGAITSIKADATQVYGTSYAFGAGAAYEGTFALDPMTGQINWQSDCLGDTYDIAAAGQVLYNVSHQHDCTVIGSFPDTNPRVRWQKAGAQTTYPTGIQTRDDVYGWASTYGLLGTPYAGNLHWYPNFAFGSYTSARQAGWAVDTSADGQWVVVGGEFPRVNNVAQQGITRFRTRAGAPNTSGPTYSTVPATPVPTTSAVSFAAGEARVSFGTAWDYDDEELTYEVLRNNNTWVQHHEGEVELLDPAARRVHRQEPDARGHVPLPGADHRPQRQHPVEPGLQQRDDRHRLAQRVRRRGPCRRGRRTCGGSVSRPAPRPWTGPASTTPR